MRSRSLALAAAFVAVACSCAHDGGSTAAEVAALREEVRALRQQREEDLRRIAALEERLLALQGGSHPAPATVHVSTGAREASFLFVSEAPASGPPDAYDAGIAAMERGDLATAARELERFLAERPEDRRADNAGLALGEVLRRQQLPGRALQVWERVVTEYPAGDAVPYALLRYGETCRALGRNAAARAAFLRVTQNHPGTEAATRAGALLAAAESEGK